MWFYSLVHYLQGDLQHVRRITANGHDQPPFAPAFPTCQDSVIKQRLTTWRTTKYHIRRAHLLLQQPLKFAVPGRQDPKRRIRPALAVLLISRDGVEALKDVLGGLRELVVDNVDVADRRAAQHQRETHVPVGLVAAAEDGDGVHLVAADDEAGGGEGGAESCEGFGVEEAGGLALGCEKSYGTCGSDFGSRGVLLLG